MPNRFRVFATLLALTVLGGCASMAPFPVPENNPSLASVRANLSAYRDKPVTWGGEILSVQIKADISLISILAKPLDRDGEPQRTDTSAGRFLVRFEGFKDPAVYAHGRMLTVTGTVAGEQTQKIGDYAYHYPLIDAVDSRLWPMPPRYHNDDGFGVYPWYPWWYPAYPVYVQPSSSPSLPAPRKR